MCFLSQAFQSQRLGFHNSVVSGMSWSWNPPKISKDLLMFNEDK